MNPEYPIYIISKGRWESRLTSKALEKCCIPYYIVIEPQEYDYYAAEINDDKILVLPFSNLGQGSIPARNWVWEYAIEQGYKRHWILDDNIRDFYRLNKNMKYRITSGTIFKAAEDFVERYKNVRLAGFQYELLTPRKYKHPPFILNTRIYSCILIDNRLEHRWRGRYNEDTDLSLRVLKDGDCTILFCAFLADKQATMNMAGGNTDELYKGCGRLDMAKSLCEQHPDVTKIVWKWGRWQHRVDYSGFKLNRLTKRDDIEISKNSDNYGMLLKTPERVDDE
jgi:hypothetical protein